MIWKACEKSISLDTPLVMGVLNITPDSFYDGGKFVDVENACAAAVKMQDEGADIIDIGGESSRPGAKAINANEELKRALPVIKKIAREINIPISIDTYKAEVASAAIEAGAVIVNDISAAADPDMLNLIKRTGAGIVLMHKHGKPETMQNEPLNEKNVLADVIDFLRAAVKKAVDFGIEKEQIVIDPGIGFGKTFAANEILIGNINRIADLAYPVLIGASRKKFIGEITGREADERLAGSIAAHIVAALNGAKIIRTHDVAETKDALKVAVRLAGQNGAGSRTGTSAQRRAELPLRDFDNPPPFGHTFPREYSGCATLKRRGECGQNG